MIAATINVEAAYVASKKSTRKVISMENQEDMKMPESEANRYVIQEMLGLRVMNSRLTAVTISPVASALAENKETATPVLTNIRKSKNQRARNNEITSNIKGFFKSDEEEFKGRSLTDAEILLLFSDISMEKEQQVDKLLEVFGAEAFFNKQIRIGRSTLKYLANTNSNYVEPAHPFGVNSWALGNLPKFLSSLLRVVTVGHNGTAKDEVFKHKRKVMFPDVVRIYNKYISARELLSISNDDLRYLVAMALTYLEELRVPSYYGHYR